MRQKPIGNFIADFFCFELKLVIEIDGGQHNETPNMSADQTRDEYLKKIGLKIIRIWTNEIYENIEGVIEEIKYQIDN